jgi:hypothetical protein
MRNTADIARENDELRKSFRSSAKARIVLTEGVSASPDAHLVIESIKEFDLFSEENDPHAEHDFGQVVVHGKKYFFKIDYYDPGMEYGADPLVDEVVRVLTVMRAEDY